MLPTAAAITDVLPRETLPWKFAVVTVCAADARSVCLTACSLRYGIIW